MEMLSGMQQLSALWHADAGRQQTAWQMCVPHGCLAPDSAAENVCQTAGSLAEVHTNAA